MAKFTEQELEVLKKHMTDSEDSLELLSDYEEGEITYYEFAPKIAELTHKHYQDALKELNKEV